jgi:signal recognition particle GTPase
VAVVTADTYRISAVEQLKTYADIIDVPLDIVYTPDEMKAAFIATATSGLCLSTQPAAVRSTSIRWPSCRRCWG